MGALPSDPSEIIASFQTVPHASRSKRRIHGMTVAPLEHSCDANPRMNARNATWQPRSAVSRTAWPACLHQRFA
jgi:hypothetical protein